MTPPEETSAPSEATQASAPSETAPSETAAKEDVVLIHGKTDDGALKILRKQGEQLSAGELRPLEEGKPVQGNVLTLKPRPQMPLVCDVEDEIEIPRAGKGPAKVATKKYRDGWDKLWGKRRKKPN